MAALTFQAIGLHGGTIGSAILKEDKIEWRDRANTAGGEFAKEGIKSMNWQMVGAKGFLKVYMNDGSMSSMDGFAQTDYEAIREFVSKKYGKELTKESVSISQYGALLCPVDGCSWSLSITPHLTFPLSTSFHSTLLSETSTVIVRGDEFRRDHP